MCLQKLINLDAKGAKRSIKMRATNFYKSFFKDILLYVHEPSAVKIRSVRTYVLSKVDSCFCEAVEVQVKRLLIIRYLTRVKWQQGCSYYFKYSKFTIRELIMPIFNVIKTIGKFLLEVKIFE